MLIILIIHIIFYYDQNISLIFMRKMNPKSGCDICLDYFTAQRQYTVVQRYVHLWNNYLYIIILSIESGLNKTINMKHCKLFSLQFYPYYQQNLIKKFQAWKAYILIFVICNNLKKNLMLKPFFISKLQCI